VMRPTGGVSIYLSWDMFFSLIFPGGEITIRSYPILLFFESLNTYSRFFISMKQRVGKKVLTSRNFSAKKAPIFFVYSMSCHPS